jgi:hypothetical protein
MANVASGILSNIRQALPPPGILGARRSRCGRSRARLGPAAATAFAGDLVGAFGFGGVFGVFGAFT